MKSKIKTLYRTFGITVCAGAVTMTVFGASAQNIFVGDWYIPGSVFEVTGVNTFTTFGSGGAGQPEGMAFDSSGDLFVSDSGGDRIDEFTPGGSESTPISTGLNDPSGLAFNSAGDLFVADHNTGNIYEYIGGVQHTYATGITDANQLVFNAAGDLFVSGNLNNTIFEIAPGGGSSKVFTTGQYLDGPNGMAFNSAGDMFVANGFSTNVVEITPGGTQSVYASGLDGGGGLAFDNSGNMFVTDENDGDLTEISGGTETTYATGLGDPTVLAIQGVTLPVPEPSTFVLALVGGAALLFRRRKS